ncbi:hypothetical protein [Halopelagius longus]|uniref:Uncharacterized protein n=1 Tax=Halopelagius longus TaxID=1236180 RepID=A0A1H1GUS7_9EURY|nr:hypothetical protein [Halopelagius longus]SDR16813.1 hypothetical protein SAMN05216278_3870 [Halopelagius longus]
MSQEAPTKREEGDEQAVEASSELEDLLFSEIEDIEAIPESLKSGSLSSKVEELSERLRESQNSDLGGIDDPEVRRAIQRIDSEQDATTEVSRDPQDAAEQVAEIYDGNRLGAMRELLEEHKLRIVQQLLASETGALSPKEVAFRNEGLISESTVRDHLRTLTEKGFVEKLEPDVESIPNEMPRTFYAASKFAIELLQQMGLWENLGMLYQIYDSLDRPEDIQRIEEWDGRPTPNWL